MQNNALKTPGAASARPPITERLAEWASDLAFADIPKDAAGVGQIAFADTLSVMLAGVNENVSRKARTAFTGAAGNAVVVGTDLKCAPEAAALVNGVAAHALDFDDSNSSMFAHPSSGTIPAILAIADETDVSGEDLITAYVAGVEVGSRIARAMTYQHNSNGWHTTSTFGTFSAAVAAARLLGLTGERMRNAIGLAASMASGIRQNFGTETKPVHAGLAAQNGVKAAKLAQAGIEASPRALEGHEGFMHLYGDLDVMDFDDALRDLGDPFEVLRNDVKLYPTCAMVLPALDIVIDAVRTGDFVPADIETVRCATSYQTLNIMRYQTPRTDMEARFSFDYCVAVALVNGDVTLGDFSDEAIRSPNTAGMMARTETVVHPEMRTIELFEPLYKAGKAFTEVAVTHRDGREVAIRKSCYAGSHLDPVDWARLQPKYRNCVAGSLAPDRADAVWQRMTQLDSLEQANSSVLLGH